jgi:hypothetical protein
MIFDSFAMPIEIGPNELQCGEECRPIPWRPEECNVLQRTIAWTATIKSIGWVMLVLAQ